MSGPKTDLAIAEAEAAAARLRLSGTVSDIQARLDPAVLAEDARQVGLTAVSVGVDGARRNPGVVAAAVAATGLVLARHRIAGIFRRRRARKPVPAAPRSSD
ncbi:hypothetical protein GCM10022268_22470 [Sphingomonas cynarae]|uniref:DUF3618 domain-containing protein n=1 Tax=Sphingomonas cynarae TaxID=930197 RepID=A0ABP7E4F4_9SPHN